MLNQLQMLLIAEAFGIYLVNIFGTRRPGGEPPTLGDNLNSTDRLIVAWSPIQFRINRLASEFLGIDFRRIQVC